MFEDKYMNPDGVVWLWNKINKLFVHKDGNKVLTDNNFTDADKAKLDSIEANANHYELPIASADNLGGIRIGKGLDIDERGVVTTVVNPDITMRWNQITNTPSTLAGYGITDAATKEELQEVREEVSHIYNFKRTLETYAELLEIQNPEEGDVYNVRETEHNYRWTAKNDGTGEFFWDDLGGFMDMSGYWSKEELVSLTEEEIDVLTGSASSVESFMKILQESNEVTLDSNLAFAQPITIDKNFTVDLGGQQVSSVINTPLFVVDGGTLTLKGNGTVNVTNRIGSAINGGKIVIDGGSYDAGDVAFDARGTGAKITMNKGTIEAVEGGIGAFDGAEILVNGGTIEISDNFTLFTNGTAGRGGNTITMNGGTMVGNITSATYEACGVYIANNDTFIMNGGSITGNGGCGLLMRAGNVTINNGEITAIAGPNVPGYVGDKKKQMSASAVIYDEASNYPGKAGMSLVIDDGVFTGVDHAVEILSNEETPNVTIAGGSFTPEL